MTIHLVETSEEDTFSAVSTFIAELLDEGQVSAAVGRQWVDAWTPHDLSIMLVAHHFLGHGFGPSPEWPSPAP